MKSIYLTSHLIQSRSEGLRFDCLETDVVVKKLFWFQASRDESCSRRANFSPSHHLDTCAQLYSSRAVHLLQSTQQCSLKIATSMFFSNPLRKEVEGKDWKTTARRMWTCVLQLIMAVKLSKSSMAIIAAYFWKKVTDEAKDEVNSMNMSCTGAKCACARAAVLVHRRHFVFSQTLAPADVRRAITQKTLWGGCVSISALFYLDFPSVANLICVHAFRRAVNCASPQSVFAKFSQGLPFAVSGGSSPGMEHSGCGTVSKATRF